MMDARRNQVYTGVYEYVKTGQGPVSYQLKSLVPQCAVPVAQIAEILNGYGREVILLGDGIPVYTKALQELLTVPYGFAPAHVNRQRAAAFGRLAMQYIQEGKIVSADSHAPEYLRLSQAEREKNEKGHGNISQGNGSR